MSVFSRIRRAARLSLSVAFVLVFAFTFMARSVIAQSDGIATSTIAATSTDASNATSSVSNLESASSTANSTSATTTPDQAAALPSVAPSTVSINCTMAYTSTLYDTPSGHLDPGYTLDTSGSQTGPGVAHAIGTQSWADCIGADGNKYEIKLSPEAYAALGVAGAAMPQETLDLSQTSSYTLIASTSPSVPIAPQSPTQSTASTTESVVASVGDDTTDASNEATSSTATSTATVPEDVSTTTEATTTLSD